MTHYVVPSRHSHRKESLVTSRAIIVAVTLALGFTATRAAAQPRPKIAVALEARSEGRPDADAAAASLLAAVRRGLEAMTDVEIVPSDGARRAVWIVGGTTPGAVAASVIVTERYDRETLMVLGIEDEEMAHRMMALQIVIDHQIFTGRAAADVGRRIVAAIDTGVFARLRALPPKP
jgi:hypothetical protein